MEKQLTGSIALTKLPQAVIQTKKGKTGNIRCLVLPIEGNGLTEKDGAVYMDIRLTVREIQDKYGQNGFISKSSKPINGKKYSELTDAEKAEHNKYNPILGNIKDWSSSSKPATTTSIQEEDDLPF